MGKFTVIRAKESIEFDSLEEALVYCRKNEGSIRVVKDGIVLAWRNPKGVPPYEKLKSDDLYEFTVAFIFSFSKKNASGLNGKFKDRTGILMFPRFTHQTTSTR